MPDDLGDRYLVNHRLTRSCHYAVYAGVDRRLARPVAFKVPHADRWALPIDAADAVPAEARCLAASASGGVLRLYDVDWLPDGRPLLVVELLSGVPLTRLLADAALTLPAAVGVTARLATAVAAVHAAGYCHRALRAEHVRVGDDGRLTLHGFGQARRLAPITPGEPAAADVLRDLDDLRTVLLTLAAGGPGAEEASAVGRLTLLRTVGESLDGRDPNGAARLANALSRGPSAPPTPAAAC